MKKSKLFILPAIALVSVLTACNFDPVIPNRGNTDPVIVSKTVEYDYYSDVFGLGKDHVFQTLVYNDLISLISDNTSDTNRPTGSQHNPDGDYVILFGGAWDEDTKAVIGIINDEAKSKNIEKVYFFDPYLDGRLSGEILTDVVGNTGKITEGPNSGRIGYTYSDTDYVYDDFNIKDYYYGGTDNTLLYRINRAFTVGGGLTADASTPVVTPLLVSVRRAQNPQSSQITARVGSPFIGKADGYALSSSDKTAYKTGVDTLLGGVAGKAVYDPFLAISNPTGYSGANNTHLTVNNYFSTVSYPELIKLLEAPGERFIFFGGTWCPNTAAIYNAIQDAATAAGYEGKIYLYDPIITAVQSRPNTRNNETAAVATAGGSSGTHSVLYANLLENYFTGFVSRWNNPDSASQKAFGATGAATNFSINGKYYSKMCVPNLILYNKAVSGGIVDSFESELTWNGTDGTGKGGTGNVTSDGTPITVQGGTYAYKYAALAFGDLFAKAGLSEAYIQTEYTFKSDIHSDAKRTVISAEKGNSKIKIFTYYLSSDYENAVKDLKDAGITVVKINAITFYYITGGVEAGKILDATKDGSIYTNGIILEENNGQPSSDNNESGTNSGGGNTPPPGNGSGSGGDTEIC